MESNAKSSITIYFVTDGVHHLSQVAELDCRLERKREQLRRTEVATAALHFFVLQGTVRGDFAPVFVAKDYDTHNGWQHMSCQPREPIWSVVDTQMRSDQELELVQEEPRQCWKVRLSETRRDWIHRDGCADHSWTEQNDLISIGSRGLTR